MAVVLHAYKYSVYSWIARLVLAEKGVAHDTVEVNPFAPDMPPEYLKTHPFRRVPALVHDDVTLFETAAIACYVDEAFPGPALQPEDVRGRARMRQIVSIIDSYGYWPMVRQVFSHRVFRPRTGQLCDNREVQSGLDASARVMAALESLASPDGFLIGDRVSLADLHLAPMMAYFVAASEGCAMLRAHKALSAWWTRIQTRPEFKATEPNLPGR